MNTEQKEPEHDLKRKLLGEVVIPLVPMRQRVLDFLAEKGGSDSAPYYCPHCGTLGLIDPQLVPDIRSLGHDVGPELLTGMFDGCPRCRDGVFGGELGFHQVATLPEK